MWFKLASATFTNHLGSMDSLSNTWSIQYQLSGGLSRGTSPTSVTKGSSASITLTLSSGATYNNDLSVTVGGTAVSVTPSISGSTISFTLSAVSGAVVITASATGGSTGGGNSGGDSNSGSDSTTTYKLSDVGTLHENKAFDTSDTNGATLTDNTIYYSVLNIPVTPGSTIRIPYARRTYELDSSKNGIKNYSLKNDYTDYTVTVSDTTTYISTCIQYADCAVADAVIEIISEGTYYLKDKAETYYEGQSFVNTTSSITDDTWSQMKTNANYNTFMYIPATGGSTIRCLGRRFVEYDSSKTPLTNYSLNGDRTDYTTTLSDNCAYFSVACNIADYATVDECVYTVVS